VTFSGHVAGDNLAAMNATFAELLAVSVVLSSVGAACGGGGGAGPKTPAAETAPADLPASTKAETKTDPAFASCHNAYKPASNDQDVAADVAAMAKGCANTTKMQKVGDTRTGTLGDKTPVKLPLAVLAGKCYRVYGMSQSTMQDFDIAVIDSAGALVAEDTTDDVSPVISEDGKVCFKMADTVTLRASAGAGGGTFAIEVWSD
jgi:hypothetical protein